jgi:iron complex transport system substrate-binding protein
MRIVSLLPSATEIICQLGLESELVGVTHECDYPPSMRTLPKVTRALIPAAASSREIDALVRERLQSERALYTLDLPMLRELRPDLIVTQALCDVCAVAEDEVRAAACSLPGQPCVINLEPSCLADVFDCLRVVGAATDRVARAAAEIAALETRVAAVSTRSATIVHCPRVVVLEWIDPPFSSGHWSPELVRLAGGEEVIGAIGERSRTIDWRQIVAARPEVLVVACCGFDVPRTLADLPILRGYPGWNDLPCVRSQRVYVVDGSAYFSRPGPRLVDSLEILAHALDPIIHPLPAGLPAARQVIAERL